MSNHLPTKTLHPCKLPFHSRTYYTQEDYQNLINCVEAGMPVAKAIKLLHFVPKTANNILSKWRTTHTLPRQRGGTPHTPYDETMARKFLIDFYQHPENRQKTLKEIQLEMYACGWKPLPSRSWLARLINNLNITRKITIGN